MSGEGHGLFKKVRTKHKSYSEMEILQSLHFLSFMWISEYTLILASEEKKNITVISL